MGLSNDLRKDSFGGAIIAGFLRELGFRAPGLAAARTVSGRNGSMFIWAFSNHRRCCAQNRVKCHS